MTGDIRAVIFDCDGTLVDSEESGLDVLHGLACAEGLSFTRAQADARFRGARMADCVAWIAAQLPDRPPDFDAEFTRRVRSATEARFRLGMDPLPGARELLQQLLIPYCVATNGPREKVELTLQLTGLRPLFGERVFSAYEVGHFKPAPGLFLHAAVMLGQPPAHCAVVEDSVPGIQAGLAAGMRVFALCEAGAVPADLGGQVVFIDGLTALREHLGASAVQS
jgi:HAD superfamily hydrolase (TIGR01509 family)